MMLTHPVRGLTVTVCAACALGIGAATTQAGVDKIDPVLKPAVAYEAQALPSFAGSPYPRINGINNSGHAAGTNYACPFILSCLSQTFLYNGRELIHTSAEMIANVPAQFVGLPGTLDMSNGDHVLIRMAVPDVGVYHYLWEDGETILISGDPDDDPTDGGPLVPIPPPPGTGWQVNDNGVVVGTVHAGETSQAFLWNRNDGVTQLIDPPPGFTSINARGINNLGHIVGTVSGATVRAFLWADGEFTILDPLPGAIESYGLRVNDVDTVVGTSRVPTAGNHVHHLVMWQDGEVFDSVELAHPDGLIQAPMGINAGNEVVGYFWPTASEFQHFGFRWSPDDGFHKLTGTITNIINLNIWAAEAVNDQGQIAAWGDDPNFTGGAFILTPVFDTPGDLNGDDVVDEQDRALFCDVIGAMSGRPGFVAAADLNDDGVIDHKDLQLFNDILPPCAGDVVSSDTFQPPPDGVADGADLAYLLGAWADGPSCADMVTSATFAPPPDGDVDGADLAYLLGGWGTCD